MRRGAVRHWLHNRSQFQRIVAVAAFGAAMSWVTYEAIFFINPFEPRATLSWLLAFVIGVVRQHHLHRQFAFPYTEVAYRTSLRRLAITSVTVALMVGTTNYALVTLVGLHHRLVWVLCLMLVAASNFAALKLFVFRPANPRV